MTRTLIRTFCLVALAAVFVVAGVSKAWTPGPFARVVAFLLPEQLSAPAIVILVTAALAAFEVAVGLGVAIWPRSRGVLAAVIGTLAVFAGALGVLATSPGAPGCGCLSVPRASTSGRDATLGIARNGAMIGLAAWSWPRRRHPAHSAFTLIELLVVISLVAVLVAIALPALGRVRTSARVGGGMQVARQLVGSLGLYAGDHRGEFPYFGTQGDPSAPIVVHGKELRWQYFRAHRWFWASIVYPDYIDATRDVIEGPDRAAGLAARGYPSGVIASRYQLTSSIAADPRFWQDGSRHEWMRTSYFRPMRHSDVVHPASKGILTADLAGPGGVQPMGPEYPIGLADGSAQALPMAYFESAPAVARPFGAVEIAIDSTPGGLEGRDF